MTSYEYYDSYTFPVNLFKVEVPFPAGAPYMCEEHSPYCFRADMPFGDPVAKAGTWKLITPIDLTLYPEILSRKVTTVKIKGRQDYWGSVGAGGSVHVVIDGTEVWKKLIQRTYEWYKNEWFSLNIDCTGHKTLDFWVYQSVSAPIFGGWIFIHDAELFVQMVGYSDIPKPTANVRFTITDKKTGKAINNAYLALMFGNRIISDGYSDPTGNITLPNIDEGGYEAVVEAGGYHEFSQAVQIKAPETWYRISLAAIPVEPLPWYIPYVVAGVGILAFITVAPAVVSAMRKPRVQPPPPPPPQIIVVR